MRDYDLYQAAVIAGDPEAPMKVAILEGEIAQAAFEAQQPVPIEMTDDKKTQYSNDSRSYREKNSRLVKNRGQAYALILGQCTQLLQDRMKQDSDWNTVSTSFDPLLLYCLIEKTILAQTEDQYPFAAIYDQEMALYTSHQETLNNTQWYERFNTKVDVANAIGVTREHKALNEFVAQEQHTQAYETLTVAQKETVQNDAKERYLSYIMLRQSGKQHSNLKVDLQNDFTTGDNHYPKTRQEALHLLDKYTQPKVQRTIQAKGSSFAQKGKSDDKEGKRGKNKKKGKQDISYDLEFWKDKPCFRCGKHGHPRYACTEDDDDDSKSSASVAASVKKLSKDMKSMSKKLMTVNTQ